MSGDVTGFILNYGKGNCPDSLAWDKEAEFCVLGCLANYYTDDQLLSISIITKILGSISFLLCYFFCFTALLRPVMRTFPNSNTFWLHFSFMLATSSVLFPLFLGDRYVFCDSNTKPGSENWACVISAILLHYGFLSGYSWFAIFHITSTFRIYLVKLPSITPYIWFIYSYGVWSLITLIVGISLGYIIHQPGQAACGIFKNNTFNIVTQVCYFYVLALIAFVCFLLILVRLVAVCIANI